MAGKMINPWKKARLSRQIFRMSTLSAGKVQQSANVDKSSLADVVKQAQGLKPNKVGEGDIVAWNAKKDQEVDLEQIHLVIFICVPCG